MNGDGTSFLKAMAITGIVFSITFMILQLIPIPGLSGVHFGIESYIMLVVWIVLGLISTSESVSPSLRSDEMRRSAEAVII